MLSIRRLLCYAQRVKIITLRFGRVGSTEVVGPSYAKIGTQLFINPASVHSVCYSYLQRGARLRPPGFKPRLGRLKLKPHIIK